ncbi:MAG: tRNA (adenosine(37)-N6)-threonylcarbamoyltransferase complex ATPase subunit type 1 TsaE [Fibrobacter sp.]|jgi:tRNA threonylcarbamoyladenosine biosynthesis protein TsaE|nr:tRNA (adenosine(37)-N6)-threonylcarbamoyltransferase complex ATPase subunit type 1 TsaE [Fibrobacter sp.]
MIVQNENETLLWAEQFAKTLKPGAVVAISGNLGAGKTVISRGICKALGFKGIVCSPTYTIVHEYPNTPPLYHLDLYRLNYIQDLEEIGFDHLISGEGITLIEWPERLGENTLGITHWVNVLILSETQRKITVSEKNPLQK